MISFWVLSILVLVFYILYKHLIFPYILYKRYIKYGKGEFYPFIGVFYGAIKRVKAFKDVDHHLKHMYDDGKDHKIFVENNSTNAIVKISDAEYIKEFTQLEGKIY